MYECDEFYLLKVQLPTVSNICFILTKFVFYFFTCKLYVIIICKYDYLMYPISLLSHIIYEQRTFVTPAASYVCLCFPGNVLCLIPSLKETRYVPTWHQMCHYVSKCATMSVSVPLCQ